MCFLPYSVREDVLSTIFKWSKGVVSGQFSRSVQLTQWIWQSAQVFTAGKICLTGGCSYWNFGIATCMIAEYAGLAHWWELEHSPYTRWDGFVWPSSLFRSWIYWFSALRGFFPVLLLTWTKTGFDLHLFPSDSFWDVNKLITTCGDTDLTGNVYDLSRVTLVARKLGKFIITTRKLIQ